MDSTDSTDSMDSMDFMDSTESLSFSESSDFLGLGFRISSPFGSRFFIFFDRAFGFLAMVGFTKGVYLRNIRNIHIFLRICTPFVIG
jgi:hypothetical protein